jgi:hypothetical protein
MDPVTAQQEHQRQQDEEFWEDQRRDEQLPRSRGPRSAGFAPADASTDDPTQLKVASGYPPPNPKKKGKPVLTSAVVMLALVGAGAAFMMWSSDGLPFAKKKAIPAPVAVAGTLPATMALPDPALPTVAGPVPVAVPDAPEDPKLQEQLARLEARLDQLVAGFKATGYIKDTAGQDGAVLQLTDFLPHPSTVSPPAPVVVAPRPTALRKMVRRPVVADTPQKPSHQVLSVDMWDGRPSVVVGVAGAPAGQVRVLQPGDSYNGVTLTGVDVPEQRATFSDGTRSVSIAVERQP